MTQKVDRAQHGPTYNGPIYLYRLSILSGRAQQTFSRAYALLGPAVDMPLHIYVKHYIEKKYVNISVCSKVLEHAYVYSYMSIIILRVDNSTIVSSSDFQSNSLIH